jgi:hypothetical protein
VAINNIELEDYSADIDELQAQITGLPHIKDLMSAQEFIDPVDELIDDNDDDIMASVVERYSGDIAGEAEEAKPNDIEEDDVPIADVIRALELLKIHQLKSKHRSALHLSNLDKLGRDLMAEKCSRGRQSTITSFFVSK